MVKFKKGQEWLSYSMKTFVKYSTIDQLLAHTRKKADWRIRVKTFNHRTLSYEVPGIIRLPRWLKSNASNDRARETPLTKVKLIFAPMKMRIICAGRIHFNFYFTHSVSVCINRQVLMATTWHTHSTPPPPSSSSPSSKSKNKTNQPVEKNETVRNTVLIE